MQTADLIVRKADVNRFKVIYNRENSPELLKIKELEFITTSQLDKLMVNHSVSIEW